MAAKSESRRRIGLKRLAVALLLIAIVALLLGAILIFPAHVISRDLGSEVQALKPDQLAKAKNDIRTTLLQAIAGVALATGAIATLRQLRFTRLQLEHSQEQLGLTGKQLAQAEESQRQELRLSRQGQITERFTRAIDQLGSQELDVRLGGIYALDRIARDSADDRHTIAQVLSAYIREHSPWPPARAGQYIADAPLHKLPDLEIRASDVQAALEVLGQKMFHSPSALRKIVHADLRKSDLSGLNLEDSFFSNCQLSWTHLTTTNLEKSMIMYSDLSMVNMFDAHLEASSFTSTNVTEADFDEAHLDQAEFFNINFEEAKGLDAAHLHGSTADSSTKWPEGFDPASAGVRIED